MKAKTKGKFTYSLKKNWKIDFMSTYNNTKEDLWCQLKKGSKLNIAKRDEIALNLVNKKQVFVCSLFWAARADKNHAICSHGVRINGCRTVT